MVQLGRGRPRRLARRGPGRRRAQAVGEVVVVQDRGDGLGDGVGVAGVHGQAGAPGHQLLGGGPGRGDHRGARAHGLGHRQAVALPQARVADHRRAPVQGGQLRAGDEPGEPQAVAQRLGGRGQRLPPAVRPHHHQRDVVLRQAGERLQQAGQVLAGLQRAHGQHVAAAEAVAAPGRSDLVVGGVDHGHPPGHVAEAAGLDARRLAVRHGGPGRAQHQVGVLHHRLQRGVEEAHAVAGEHPLVPPPGQVVQRRHQRDGAGRDGVAGGVDDVDGAGRPLDGRPAGQVPRPVERQPGQGQVVDREGGAPGVGRRPVVACAHADLLDAPRGRHRGHLVDHRAGGAPGHPVPALLDDDGGTHGRASSHAGRARGHTTTIGGSPDTNGACPARRGAAVGCRLLVTMARYACVAREHRGRHRGPRVPRPGGVRAAEAAGGRPAGDPGLGRVRPAAGRTTWPGCWPTPGPTWSSTWRPGWAASAPTRPRRPTSTSTTCSWAPT